jgi:hypothetical protein
LSTARALLDRFLELVLILVVLLLFVVQTMLAPSIRYLQRASSAARTRCIAPEPRPRADAPKVGARTRAL